MRTLSSFGADQSATDNSASLSAAFDFGGTIEIDGAYKIASQCVATKPVQLIGRDKMSCALLATAAFTDNAAMIQINPDMSYGADGYEFQKWDKITIRGEKRRVKGLSNRQADARKVCDGAVGTVQAGTALNANRRMAGNHAE